MIEFAPVVQNESKIKILDISQIPSKMVDHAISEVQLKQKSECQCPSGKFLWKKRGLRAAAGDLLIESSIGWPAVVLERGLARCGPPLTSGYHT